MKTSLSICALLSGFALFSFVYNPPARAQRYDAPRFGDVAELQPVRKELEQANSKIEACHVVWKRVLRIAPLSAEDADPEKWAASALKQAREAGETEEKAQELAAMERREALRSQKGREIEFLFDYTRVANRVLCITEQFPSPTQQSKTLEYFDGTNFMRADLEFDHKVLSYQRGEVRRHTEDVVSYSVGGEQVMRLLLGFALDQEFGPRNPRLTDKNSTLKDERPGLFSVVQEPYLRDTGSNTKTWTRFNVFNFDKQRLSLQSIENYDSNLIFLDKKITFKRGDISSLLTASDYKQYEGGIWYPSKITVKSNNITQEYSLVEAQFNDEVKPSSVLLPADILITDGRFGFGFDAVEYYADDGFLLSDEQVKERKKGK